MTAPGLTQAQASARLLRDGANVIARTKSKSAWALFAEQFASPMIGLLLGAAVLAAVLREVSDAIAIAVIVVLNAVVGFVQQYRAARAIEALRALTAPRARVLRDGVATTVPSGEVVVGDALLLEPGDIVAADARLDEAHQLTTNEALLTGESTPVEKGVAPVAQDAVLAERSDCVFSSTAIGAGTGRATVFATGMNTEIGKIAHLLASIDESRTPLEKRLADTSRTLLFACVAVVALVAVLGAVRGAPWLEVLLSSVSLAVAAVPEGLPAIVTIALALGVQRMAKRHVLVRRLNAVETLGCATVICSDKTGTLTTGVMTVREQWGEKPERLLFAAAACCDAELAGDGGVGVGDTTELALLAAAAPLGIHRRDIERQRARVHVKPFDSARKMMSVERSDGVVYVKGAVETLLSRCSNSPSSLRDEARRVNEEMAGRGLRVLAIATGEGSDESGLTLVGLIGIADPPRKEAITAIAEARAAGIRTLMITGDHPTTAYAIARELGLLVEGEDPSAFVYARATAASKLEIVRQWRARGAVVAMTGDGVNDAPAIKEADIGIAMGKGGTEVTREAADLVLTDDNYASIVAAVREGRAIYDNIRKTIIYLLAGNMGELLLFIVAAVAGWPVPLLPLQILWINLVTDGLPALALVTDPVDSAVLARGPRRPDESILDKAAWRSIVVTSLLDGGTVLAVFYWALRGDDVSAARTLAFSTLVFCELFRSFAARSSDKLFWEVGAFTNLRLLAVVAFGAGLQLLIHHVEALAEWLGVEALGFQRSALAIGLGLVPVSLLEISKLVRRAWRRSLPRTPPTTMAPA